VRRNHSHAALLAEIGGENGFNANMHPPITPAEILYPAEPSRNGLEPLFLRDLVLVPDYEAERVHVMHVQSRREVVPLDLGFQRHDLRPPLYQFVALLTPPCQSQLPLPATANGRPSRSRHRPRITIDTNLVVARESWLMPADAAPQWTQSEPLGKYMLRVAQWRAELGLPVRCFVRLRVPRKASKKAPPIRPARQRAGHLKPQYMDLECPIYVDLLRDILRMADGHNLHIEECYPDIGHGLTRRGEPHAGEIVLESYSTG
jgi:hypothetical protein